MFVPGKSLTVPGAFRLDVLPAAATGTSQVRTTWLDKTPPVMKTIKARLQKPWGSTSSTLVVDLAGSADGAGIVAAEVTAGGATTRLDAERGAQPGGRQRHGEDHHEGAEVGNRPDEPGGRHRQALGGQVPEGHEAEDHADDRVT